MNHGLFIPRSALGRIARPLCSMVCLLVLLTGLVGCQGNQEITEEMAGRANSELFSTEDVSQERLIETVTSQLRQMRFIISQEMATEEEYVVNTFRGDQEIQAVVSQPKRDTLKLKVRVRPDHEEGLALLLIDRTRKALGLPPIPAHPDEDDKSK
jgi:hypothetical protein